MSIKADLDRQIQQHQTQLWSRHWETIRQEAVNKKLLLVEGDDDKKVVEALLEWRSPALWTTKVIVGVAGDRSKVLDKLKANPSWYGLVDRDTWDQSDVQTKESSFSQLTITQAWCMENHFCVPTILATAINVDVQKLNIALAAQFSGWFRHGAIWWTWQRAQDKLNETRPKPLRDFAHPAKDPCPDEATLRQRLIPYADALTAVHVDEIIRAINDRSIDVATLGSEQSRIEQGIHGKLFFREVIVHALNGLLGQHDTETWRVHIADSLGRANQWPAYLVNLADDLLAP